MQPNIQKVIKFAVVGCGRISLNHFQAIQALDRQAKLVSICDIDPLALENAKKITNVDTYLNLEDLLNNSDADVISLCTPSGLHAQQTIQIAKNKRHIISEKPMATNWQDGLLMNHECFLNNVQLFVVKQNRFNTTLQQLKKAIVNNRFGKIFNIAMNVFWTRPQSYYDAANWRGKLDMDGGALMNQASHYVDLLTWLFGPIKQVYGICETKARKIEAEDSAVVSLKWSNGPIGTLNVSMLTYPSNLEGSLTIIGENGTVRIGGIAVNEIQVWQFAKQEEEDNNIKMHNYDTKSVYGHGHHNYYKNVVNFLNGHETPIISGLEGLKSLEVLAAIYESSNTNKPINLPLNREQYDFNLYSSYSSY